ncbi:MAG: 23S rRNA (pseudouridine(1915)-N(3))-methyltransferase RlmH [Pseudomonadota bacterium]
MKVSILAVGAMKSGPERTLLDDYIARAAKIGRSLGVRSVEEFDVASGGGRDAEAARLVSRCPKGAQLVLLDEHGTARTSEDFARDIANWRDQGIGETYFLIGGAEGNGAAIRSAATTRIAFGPQTWPHKLVRVMVAEQIYRALTILSGMPYHKV